MIRLRKKRDKSSRTTEFSEERQPGSSASYAVSRLSANLARDLHGSSTSPGTIPRLAHLSPPVWIFSHPACGAAVVHDDGTDRENHATRRRGEIDSRCDAGDENIAQERRNARQDSRKLKERGEDCRVRLLREARHYRSLFVAKSSGSRDECAKTRNTFSNTCLDLRSFDEPRHPRTRNVSSKEIFKKLKRYKAGRAAANASCVNYGKRE